jgi:hypothetical protein
MRLDSREVAESQLPTWSWAGFDGAILRTAKGWDTYTAIKTLEYHFSDEFMCLCIRGPLLKGFCKKIAPWC